MPNSGTDIPPVASEAQIATIESILFVCGLNSGQIIINGDESSKDSLAMLANDLGIKNLTIVPCWVTTDGTITVPEKCHQIPYTDLMEIKELPEKDEDAFVIDMVSAIGIHARALVNERGDVIPFTYKN